MAISNIITRHEVDFSDTVAFVFIELLEKLKIRKYWSSPPYMLHILLWPYFPSFMLLLEREGKNASHRLNKVTFSSPRIQSFSPKLISDPLLLHTTLALHCLVLPAEL